MVWIMEVVSVSKSGINYQCNASHRNYWNGEIYEKYMEKYIWKVYVKMEKEIIYIWVYQSYTYIEVLLTQFCMANLHHI